MDNTVSYKAFINGAPDDHIWKPIPEEEVEHFLSLVQKAEYALEHGTKKEKGDTLEELMTYVYERFDELADIYPNVNEGDNQFDHIIEFVDGMVPTFIHQHIGLRIIGESKNHNDSIGVREVADLNELLRYKRARLGIFSSAKSFSRGRGRCRSPWQFAEGKRRKLALATNNIIIGFTIQEIKSLTHNNFYTMIKQKYNNLVDEITDDFTDHVVDDESIPYHQRLYLSLFQLKENGIITPEAFEQGKQSIIDKYGPIEKV
jgi:hypothetical protein